MSAFTSQIDAYCDAYQITPSDKRKLLLHYPFFKCVHTLEYGKGISRFGASLLYPLIQNYHLKHKATCASGKQIDIRIPFNRFDLASFREVLMGACYALPEGASNIEVVVDVGGNTGMASLYFLSRLRNVCQLVVIEANPSLIQTINANLAEFRDQVKIENVCIGDDSCKSVDFSIDPNHRHSKMGTDNQSEAATIVSVPAMTLRQLLDKHNIAKADLLKMDIEGAEFSILADCEVLRRFRFMHIEVHGTVEQRDQFVQNIHELGFAVGERSYSDAFQCEEIFCSRTG